MGQDLFDGISLLITVVFTAVNPIPSDSLKSECVCVHRCIHVCVCVHACVCVCVCVSTHVEKQYA